MPLCLLTESSNVALNFKQPTHLFMWHHHCNNYFTVQNFSGFCFFLSKRENERAAGHVAIIMPAIHEIYSPRIICAVW